ncbi:MAG: RAD55 family ATPase [Candidatus Micrarchaeia archaeon]
MIKQRGIDKIPSGIPGFDEISDGGFVRNSIISLSGGVGAGKTIFGMQFLYNGITENNENGMYVCFEETKKSMYRNMLKLGWNLKTLEDSQKLTYLAYPPHEVDLFFDQEDTLINLIDKFAVSRVVFDTVTILGMHFDTKRARKEGMLKFIDKLRKWGCTSLLISETHDYPNIAKSIESLADTVVHLYNIRDKGNRKRGIEIIEMRGSKHSTSIHPFTIGSEGIEIDANSVLEVE